MQNTAKRPGGTYQFPGLPWSGQLVSFVANDDGAYQKGFTLTRPIVKGVGSHRFILAGGIVTDLATGLMWIKSPNDSLGEPFDAQQAWADAIIACEGINLGGFIDWRMPNVKELMSIMDYARVNPAVDGEYFSVAWDSYWSSTTSADDNAKAYWVGANTGFINIDSKVNTLWVLPCRGGLP